MIVAFYIFLFFFFLITFILAISILMQESRSMGLASTFGGDSGNSLFGTSTPQVLKTFTAYLGAAFVVFCVIISLWVGATSSHPAPMPTMIESE